MSETDQLCPQQHTHPKHHPDRCIFCEYGAAVREHEREQWPHQGQHGYINGYAKGREDEAAVAGPRLDTYWQRGYAAALDAARDAVAALPWTPTFTDLWTIDKADALAAIDALRGEP